MKNKTTTRLFVAAMALTFALSSTILTPATASAASQKTVTVKTQKQLDAALKDKKVTSIVIKTSKNVTLKIKDGNYSKKTLTVTSPKATINNYGDFKKISVNDGKSFTDRGEGNNILVKDTNSLKLTTGKQSSDTTITVSGKGGKISIVNNGSVDAIKVNGKSTVTVGGNAKEAPTITNNATGAKIVAAQDANVVLNKTATLTVKAGTSLDSLTVKADAKITVSKGATVSEVVVSGKATDVSLAVNGTVANVTVDTKVSVAVSGSTTGTIAITNNAEGATIQSEVKTDVTLNADAKVSLDKGAEGSSVTAGNADVKTEVTNNTSDKVTVTDSTGKETTVDSGKSETTTPNGSGNKNDSGSTNSGSTNSGSTNDSSPSGGGNNGGQQIPVKEQVVVTASAVIADTSNSITNNVIKPGDNLVASVEVAEEVEYIVKWYRGTTFVCTGENYYVSCVDSGSKLKVVVSVVSDTKEGSDTVESTVVKTVVHPVDLLEDEIFLSVGCSSASAIEILGNTYEVLDETGKAYNMSVEWTAPESYQADVAGAYVFNGVIALSKDFIWADQNNMDKVTMTVRLLGANQLSYELSMPASIDGVNEGNENNQGIAEIQGEDGIYYLCGNYLLADKFSHTSQGEGCWVGVPVTFGESVNVGSQLKAGTDAKNLQAVTADSVGITTTSTANVAMLWIDLQALYDNGVYTIYLDTDECDITPIRFYPSVEKVYAQYTGDVSATGSISIIDGNPASVLPNKLTYTIVDTKISVETPVTWVCDRDFHSAPGDYTFCAIPTAGLPMDVNKVITTVTVAKAACNEAPKATLASGDLRVSAHKVGFTPEEGVQYAVVTKSSYDENDAEAISKATWVNATSISGLTPSTEYYLLYRVAESDRYEASSVVRSLAFTTLRDVIVADGVQLVPSSTEVESGTSEEALLLPTETFAVKSDAVDDYSIALTWSSSPSYTGEVGTYVFTAAPDGDYTDILDLSKVVWPTYTVTVKPTVVIPSSVTFGLAENATYRTKGETDSISTATELEYEDAPYDVTVATTLKLASEVEGFNGAYAEGYYLPLSFVVPDGVTADTLTVVATNGSIAVAKILSVTDQKATVLMRLAGDGNGTIFEVDFDGEATKYAPVMYRIVESGIKTEAPAGGVGEYNIVFEAPEQAAKTQTEGHGGYLKIDSSDQHSGWGSYEDGTITLTGIANPKESWQVQWYFVMKNAAAIEGVRIIGEDSGTDHFFASNLACAPGTADKYNGIVYVTGKIDIAQPAGNVILKGKPIQISLLKTGPGESYYAYKTYTINVSTDALSIESITQE